MAEKSDGEVLEASEVNSHIIHRKKVIDATEYSHTGNTDFTDKITFNLTNVLNAMIVGIYFKCAFRNTGSADANVSLKINGTNLGSVYFVASKNVEGGNGTVKISTSEAAIFNLNNVTSYSDYSVSFAPLLKLLDATTSVTIRIQTSVGGETVLIDEVDIRIVYVDGFIDD